MATWLESTPRVPEPPEGSPKVPPGDRPDRRWSTLRRIWPGAICCALYLVLATATYGFTTLGPSHMAGEATASDSVEQIWWLAWAAHAFPNLHDLLLAQGQNYPYGQNFGVNGSMLALGVLFAPITKLFGPMVTWNVLVRLAFAASATSMCFVLRRWTRWWPAAFFGGLVYAYCDIFTFRFVYPFLSFAPLPPLIFLLLHEILVRQRWRPGRTGILLGLLCAVQFFVSTEVLAMTIVAGTIAAIILVVVRPQTLIRGWCYAATALASAVGVGGVLLVYPLWFAFAGPQHLNGPPHTVAYWADYLPTDLFSLFNKGGPPTKPSLDFGGVVFLGWPLVVTLLCFALFFRKRRTILFAGVMALICFVLSLGPYLWVNGRETSIPLPATIFEYLPALDGLQIQRFAIMTAMFAAGMFAIGIEELWRHLRQFRGPARFTPAWQGASGIAILGVVIVAVVIPLMPGHTYLAQPTNVPAFFTSSEENSIPAGSVVLSYPYPDATSTNIPWYFPIPHVMLYQAVGGMRFKLIGGYGYFSSATGEGGTTNPSPLEPQSVQALFDVALTNTPSQRRILSGRNLTDDLRSFLERYSVQTVLIVRLPATVEIHGRVYHVPQPLALIDPVTAAIGRPVEEGGVYAWFHVGHHFAAPPPRRVVQPPPTAQPPSTQPPATHVYVVQPGDTLWALAARYLGNPLRYPQLFALNRGISQVDGYTLVDPNLIYPGMKLLFPADATGIPPPAP